MLIKISLITLAAFGLAAFTYLNVERVGRRAWFPIICRTVAWGTLGLLLINLSCPVAGVPLRPLVLLDASLSMSAIGGRWIEARDSAAQWGEVRRFGDERVTQDTLATRGRSRLTPALVAASASERPIVVVSDGEIEDVREVPPDLLARSTTRIFSRNLQPDLAIIRVSGPGRVSAGDSIPLDVEVVPAGGHKAESVSVEVFSGANRIGQRTVELKGASGGRARVIVRSGSLSAGDHLLRVTLPRGTDAEPRTDARLHLVTITATPGVVLLASPADWDSRFLYRTLREVAQLPVRGYAGIEGGRWHSMADLRPVPAQAVRGAARRADLLILKGGATTLSDVASARGLWLWPGGERGETQVPGDWYLSAAETSPLAGAFLGQPVDSFPPAVRLTPAEAGPLDWVGLYGQLGRRGQRRPALIGRETVRVRQVTVTAEGLWRWSFRGGASEQSYRAWVAATASWLLGGSDSATGVAKPIQPVVANGRPVVFQWIGRGPATPQRVVWLSRAEEQIDTLQFDGEGRATAWLAPGEYRYRLAGAGGTVAVEQYSDELIPRPLTLTAHEGRPGRSSGRTAARDWLWLFGVCVLALSGEWLARRRLGLR